MQLYQLEKERRDTVRGRRGVIPVARSKWERGDSIACYFRSVTEKAVSLNGIETSKSHRRRVMLSRWAIRLLIALVLSIILILIFFSSGAVSR
jgi:hypothetical protein